MKTVIGHSHDVDTLDAVNAALAQISAGLEGEQPQACIVFMSVDYDHAQALAAIQSRWPGLPVVGTSSDGEMSSSGGVHEDSILLTMLAGDGFECRAAVGRQLSRGVDVALDEGLVGTLDGVKPALCIALPHPLAANASEVIRGLEARMNDVACPVVGGLAADHGEFVRMTGFFGGEIVEDAVPMLFLCGEVKVGWGIGSGWFPIGAPMLVTRSEGNKIFEVDGRRVLDVMEAGLGQLPEGRLGEYPLAVCDGADDERFFLRAVAEVSQDEGWVVCFGDVPEGSRVRLTEVMHEGILSGSNVSLRNAYATYPGDSPELALVLSCAARKWVLGSQFAEEVEVLRDACRELGVSHVPFAGFYCYGEIAPLIAGEPSMLHNETCITVLVGR